jgi:hypothetical protein
MVKTEVNVSAEAGNRGVDLVHRDHGDAISFHLLHEPTPAKHYGTAFGYARD